MAARRRSQLTADFERNLRKLERQLPAPVRKRLRQLVKSLQDAQQQLEAARASGEARLHRLQRQLRGDATKIQRQLRGDAAPSGDDPYRLALLRHFRSLLPLSLEARKPVFDLKAADGAIGSHAATAKDAYGAFESLARDIAQRVGLPLP